jgi:putative tryptophan/tyrosine transport system substrate-binding protein
MAQQAGRTYHLGCLLPSPPNEYAAFFDGLRRRGFVEGPNLTVEYRAYGQHVDLITQYATELVTARVDVIATAGDEAVRAIQQVTKAIPIVAIVKRYAGVWAGDLVGAARRQYNRRQYPRVRI